MTTIPQVKKTITALDEIGHRGVDTRDVFVSKTEKVFDQLHDTTIDEMNEQASQQNAMALAMTTVADEVSTYATNASNSATTATTKANEANASAISAANSVAEATEQANLATQRADDALAIASIDFGSFSVSDGELVLGYYDPSASTPSIVDGEFIITY